MIVAVSIVLGVLVGLLISYLMGWHDRRLRRQRDSL